MVKSFCFIWQRDVQSCFYQQQHLSEPTAEKGQKWNRPVIVYAPSYRTGSHQDVGPGRESHTLPQRPQRECLGSAVRTGRSHVTWSNTGGMSAGNQAPQITIQPTAPCSRSLRHIWIISCHFLFTLEELPPLSNPLNPKKHACPLTLYRRELY